jgi:hypothetical protein
MLPFVTRLRHYRDSTVSAKFRWFWFETCCLLLICGKISLICDIKTCVCFNLMQLRGWIEGGIIQEKGLTHLREREGWGIKSCVCFCHALFDVIFPCLQYFRERGVPFPSHIYMTLWQWSTWVRIPSQRSHNGIVLALGNFLMTWLLGY